jgi:hypothetical protein
LLTAQQTGTPIGVDGIGEALEFSPRLSEYEDDPAPIRILAGWIVRPPPLQGVGRRDLHEGVDHLHVRPIGLLASDVLQQDPLVPGLPPSEDVGVVREVVVLWALTVVGRPIPVVVDTQGAALSQSPFRLTADFDPPPYLVSGALLIWRRGRS